MEKSITVFENKTENINWKLPYDKASLKTFTLKPGQKVEFKNSSNDTYSPYEKIIARQTRDQEDQFLFSLDLKKRKNWKEPLRDPQAFYTTFLNNGQHMIQNFYIEERYSLRVPYGIPVTIELDPLLAWAKFETIEVREISRRIWNNQNEKYVNAKSQNFYTPRSDKEMKRLFLTRKRIGENYLAREFLKYGNIKEN